MNEEVNLTILSQRFVRLRCTRTQLERFGVERFEEKKRNFLDEYLIIFCVFNVYVV